MIEIARQAHVSKPILYTYFPSKFDLYTALLKMCAAEMVTRLRAAVHASTDNEERVRGAVAAYFDLAADDRETFRVLFDCAVPEDPTHAAIVDDARTECINAIAAAIATDTRLDNERSRLLAVGLVGLSQVAARHWINNAETSSKDDAAAVISDVAWRGLGGLPHC